MAKQPHWQIDFTTKNKDHKYRIHIYDEGYVGDPIQLLAGEKPIVTSEDSSDDIFSPLRPWNGTLQICTVMPNGSTIGIDELIPDNNLSRPVRLYSWSGTAWEISWQGFLSAEAFEQEYTARPQNMELNIISGLEAMDSMQLDNTTFFGMKTIRQVIAQCLKEVSLQGGLDWYNFVFFSASADNILNKYINTDVLFEKKDQMHEDEVTTYVVSKSCKEVLSNIATAFGLVVREERNRIYFCRMGEELGFYQFTSIYNFEHDIKWPPNTNEPIILSIYNAQMNGNMTWMGEDHTKTIAQGAKSVEVVANVQSEKLSLSLPSTPNGEFKKGGYSYGDNGSGNVSYSTLYLFKNSNPYSNITFGYFKGNYINVYSEGSAHRPSNPTTIQNSSLQDLLNLYTVGDVWWNERNYNYWKVAGATFAKHEHWTSLSDKTNKYSDCLLLCLLNCSGSGSNVASLGSIFSIKSIVNSTIINNGYLNISFNAAFIYAYPVFPSGEEQFTEGCWGYTEDTNESFKMYLGLRVGDKYWNGSAWQSSSAKFEVEFKGNNLKGNWDVLWEIEKKDGLFIPVQNMLVGEVELYLYPAAMGGTGTGKFMNAIVDSIDVSFTQQVEKTFNDRSENHYYELINANFKDEIVVNTDLSSDMNNSPSPYIMHNDLTGNNPVEVITYKGKDDDGNFATEERRPELDLLQRLVYFYSTSKRRLSLIARHISIDVAPLIRIIGYDNKKYTPIAEDRDWKEEISTYTCIEEVEGIVIPNESGSSSES